MIKYAWVVVLGLILVSGAWTETSAAPVKTLQIENVRLIVTLQPDATLNVKDKISGRGVDITS